MTGYPFVSNDCLRLGILSPPVCTGEKQFRDSLADSCESDYRGRSTSFTVSPISYTTTTDTEYSSHADTDDDTFQDILKRVHDLEETVDAQKDRIDELEATNEELRKTVDQQTEHVNALETELESVRTSVTGVFGTLTPMKRLLIGDGHENDVDTMTTLREENGPITARLAQVDAIDERVHDDIKREVGLLRAEHGAKLRALAEQTDADLDAGSVGDTISRVRTEGVDAVVGGRVWAKHRRAERVLTNIEDWGTKESLRAGTAYRLTRPRVRRLLNATEDLDLQSRQIAPIFDAIETLAEGTTRFTKRRTEDGVAVLYLGWPQTEH